jgi:DNA polymerase IV (DinB-like DNA polymerase)
MREKIILHVDMDYFFAQIEERENPHFKGKPIVVGADPKGGKGRGVVSTCNYLARGYGIKSGMPISKAFELCPDAVFLPVNIELYEKVSEKIMEIVKKYSKKYEIVSLDEAYLDISFCKSYKKAKELAKKLKKEIFEKGSLTCTVGIGPNKTIAKLATNSAKPNGLKVVKPNEVEKFLDPLDIEELPGIGPKTAEKFRKIGVNKIFELKKLSKSKLKEIFGKVGEKIWEKARGIDREPIAQKETIKSLGRQITFEKDTKNPELIFNTFEKLIKEVYDEIISKNFSFKTITVICRYKDFETHTKSKTLKEPLKDFNILKKESKRLLLKFLLESKKPIRLIGIRVKIE